MRGTIAATRALLRLCRQTHERSVSTISSATACVTIETTTRLAAAAAAESSDPPTKCFLSPQKQKQKQKQREPLLLGFEKLGLSPWLGKAAKELGVLFPAEIHCTAIPMVLGGKSLLLTSHFDSVGSFSLGVFSYLLPLIQCLKRDARLSAEKPECPRAIFLLSSKELAEEFLRLVKIILKSAELKPAVENGLPESNSLEDDVSIGLLVSTPDEVLRKIEEGTVDPNLINYLVFDEVDDMFNHGLGPEVQKLTSLLKEGASMSNQQRLQTILVTSMITKILREDQPSILEHLERSHAEIAGMVVELDETESIVLLESPEALKQKAEEVINSLQPAS